MALGIGQKFANPGEFMHGESMALSHDSARAAQITSLVTRSATTPRVENEENEENEEMEKPLLASLDSNSSETERRTSGRRSRARDRVMDRANKRNFAEAGLNPNAQLENMLLFIDDDLRETALAVSRVEQFLVDALGVLEKPNLPRKHVHALANNTQVLDHLDDLNSTVESLRRRMAQLASTLKS